MLTDAAEDPADKIGPNNTMQYLTDIGVNVEDASLLYALDVLKAESFGELTKGGFVDGWLATS
jgi:DCN1-like protein 1/2